MLTQKTVSKLIRLIDCFVNAVYTYDDGRIVPTNYKDGAPAVTKDEIDGTFVCGAV